MRKCVLIINLYTIRRKCHMIAESAQPRNPSNVTRGGCAQLKFRAFQKTSRAMYFAFERHTTKGSDRCG